MEFGQVQNERQCLFGNEKFLADIKKVLEQIPLILLQFRSQYY